MVGNDVCNELTDTIRHMTTPEKVSYSILGIFWYFRYLLVYYGILRYVIIYSLVGNDVCNELTDTIRHMTTPEKVSNGILSIFWYFRYRMVYYGILRYVIIYSLVGNDVCNELTDTIRHMTTPETVSNGILSIL